MQENRARNENETVLVIEDEGAIRKLSERLLCKFGYQVISASDGQEGIDIYNEKFADIDVVLLDMTMPRLSGREVLERMIRMNPDARVIISSGDRLETFAPDTSDMICGFVAKPYKLEELLGAVRTAIDT